MFATGRKQTLSAECPKDGRQGSPSIRLGQMEGSMRKYVLTLLAWASPAAALAGVHPSEIEQRLAFLANDWTIKGAEATYRENCEWYSERSFVVCNSEDSESGKPVRSVSIFGWSAASQNYTYHHYAEDGRSRSETCFANNQGGLTCLGQRRDGPKLVESRSHIWPVQGGADFRSERSENGGAWKETVRLKYVPRKR
jgi:hypothetical protein